MPIKSVASFFPMS